MNFSWNVCNGILNKWLELGGDPKKAMTVNNYWTNNDLIVNPAAKDIVSQSSNPKIYNNTHTHTQKRDMCLNWLGSGVE